MPHRNMGMIKKILKQIVFYVLIIIAWQGIYALGSGALGWWKPYAFPNPIGVAQSFLSLLGQNALLNAVLFSMKRALIGYALSIAIGVLFGLSLARFSFLRETVKPLILGIQTLPSVCWVPFAILWFGLKENAIIFVIVMGSAFSITISVDSAIRNVNPLYIKAARTMGISERGLYSKVILPASLPSLISGLRQGWSFAWRALMAAEVMSASIGIGQTLMMGRDLADINRVMLIMIIIVLIGVLIDKLIFETAERKVLKKIGYAR